MKNYESNVGQLELLKVKEAKEKRVPAKRVDIVSVRLVKESALMYKDRCVRSPEDGYRIFKQFLCETGSGISRCDVLGHEESTDSNQYSSHW